MPRYLPYELMQDWPCDRCQVVLVRLEMPVTSVLRHKRPGHAVYCDDCLMDIAATIRGARPPAQPGPKPRHPTLAALLRGDL